jgi:hypothetical protein
MGQSGCDVRLIGKALEYFPYSIECKNSEKFSISSWIKQAKENQKEGTDWLLVCKKNHMKPVVILDAEVFFDIIDKAIRYKHPEMDGRC